MIAGFTGTREPLNGFQLAVLCEILNGEGLNFVKGLHHGSCQGADTAAHIIFQDGEFGDKVITIHPPENERHMTKLIGDYHEPPLPYLVRNRNIVDACDFLITCPDSDEERLRSGTWSTYRYALREGKPVVLITPTQVKYFNMERVNIEENKLYEVLEPHAARVQTTKIRHSFKGGEILHCTKVSTVGDFRDELASIALAKFNDDTPIYFFLASSGQIVYYVLSPLAILLKEITQ